jgi:hypothetical protein
MSRAGLLLLGLFCLAAVRAEGAEPASYEALYEVAVNDWKLPGDVARTAGTQIVRTEKTCAAWSIAAHFQLAAESGGRQLAFETNLTASEALDGTSYKFETKNTLNGQSLNEIAGTASRAVPNGPGKIVLSAPDARTTALPPQALFPIAAFRWTASQWEKGQKKANYVTFDGTTEDPLNVFELLTAQVDLPNPRPEGDQQLLQGKAWRTTGSYFAYGGNESEPLSTLAQNVLANGIATQVTLDLGFANVTLTLRRVRALPEPKC